MARRSDWRRWKAGEGKRRSRSAASPSPSWGKRGEKSPCPTLSPPVLVEKKREDRSEERRERVCILSHTVLSILILEGEKKKKGRKGR